MDDLGSLAWDLKLDRRHLVVDEGLAFERRRPDECLARYAETLSAQNVKWRRSYRELLPRAEVDSFHSSKSLRQSIRTEEFFVLKI